MREQKGNDRATMAIHWQLIGIWERLLKRRAHGIDQNFFELGGTRELASAMLCEVEKIAGRRIRNQEFADSPTIRSLAERLVAGTATSDVFDRIQSGNGGVAFYFFHGDILGGGFYARRLAQLVGQRHSFYVSPPMPLSEHKLPSVEELAARKRRALQQFQPHGPYVLGGFCVGAVIAFEIARQLQVEGEEVDRVFLIEPEIGNALSRAQRAIVNRVAARRKRARDKVELFMRSLQKMDRLREIWRAPLREKTQFILTKSKKAMRGGSATSAEGKAHSGSGSRDWLIPAYQWVLTSYIPRRYAGPVTMLATDEHLEQAPFIARQWRKAVPQLHLERIPGRHLTCITTHIGAIAEKIRGQLLVVKSVVALALPSLASQF